MEDEKQATSQKDYALISLAEKLGQNSEQIRQLKEAMTSQEADRDKVTSAVEKLTDVVGALQASMSKVPEQQHSDHHLFISELVKRQATQTKFWGDLINELKQNSVRLVVKGTLVFLGLCVMFAVSQDAVKGIVGALGKAIGLPLK